MQKKKNKSLKKCLLIGLGSTIGLGTVVGTTTAFTTTKLQIKLASSNYSSLSYSSLNSQKFDTAAHLINGFKNNYIGNFVTKEFSFYLSNDTFTNIKNGKWNDDLKNMLTQKVVDMASCNMRVGGYIGDEKIDVQKLEPIDWPSLIIPYSTSETSVSWAHWTPKVVASENTLLFHDVVLKYKDGAEQLISDGLLVNEKDHDLDFQPIKEFNAQTVNYMMSQAAYVQDLINWKGYFIGLDFAGKRTSLINKDGALDKDVWAGPVKVDLKKFNTLAYDFMLSSFKAAGLVDQDLMQDASTDFDIDGWNNVQGGVGAPTDGIVIKDGKIILPAEDYFGSHSIVSKIKFTWTKLLREPIAFTLTGSYLSISQWPNY